MKRSSRCLGDKGWRLARAAWLASVCFVSGILSAAQVTIDFESGAESPGMAIDGAYASQGILFSNAAWITGVNAYPYSGVFFSGKAGLGALEGCQPEATWAFPCPGNPIRAFFPSGVSWVSVEAYDVGQNGARLCAFDAAGQQVGPDQIVVGQNYGLRNGPLPLLVTGTDIRSITLDEPYYGGFQDGIGFDNLTFVPRPMVTIGQFGPGHIQLSWNTATNLDYQLEFAPSLDSNLWSPVGPRVSGNGKSFSMTTSLSPGQKTGFYRLTVRADPD
jgi:hypothetical protein